MANPLAHVELHPRFDESTGSRYVDSMCPDPHHFSQLTSESCSRRGEQPVRFLTFATHFCRKPGSPNHKEEIELIHAGYIRTEYTAT